MLNTNFEHIDEQNFAVAARDGVLLAATAFRKIRQSTAPRAITIIGAGVAIPRGFYRNFARHLAAHGAIVITFDYRGIGGSLHHPIRNEPARLSDWGQKDIPALLDYAKRTWPDLPIHWIGHSLGGGFGLALAHNNHLIDRYLGIAVPHGYWGEMSGIERYRVAILIGILLPTLAHTCGYIPGRLTGLGENLPKFAALEWRSWIMNRNSMWSVMPLEHLQSTCTLRAPMCIMRFTDDPWASATSVERICSLFSGATYQTIVPVGPTDVAAQKIGHNGFFRSRFADTLWPRAVAWLHTNQ